MFLHQKIQQMWSKFKDTLIIKNESYQEYMDHYDIKVCHLFDKYRPYGGITVAYKKCSDFHNTRMVEIAVACCSKNDIYNKKVGARLAMERFLDGYTIELPLRSNNSDSSIVTNITKMFQGFYIYL